MPPPTRIAERTRLARPGDAPTWTACRGRSETGRGVSTASHTGLTLRYAAIFKDERTFLAAMEKAEPTSPLIFTEKGRLLRESGNVTGARAALIRAVELDPTGPAALESLGDLEMERGDLDAAESYYRRALVVRPTPAAASSSWRWPGRGRGRAKGR